MCRSKSSRKYFSALCSGSTAPGASAQKVCPGPAGAYGIRSRSRSPGWPFPSSMACRICRPSAARPSRACTSRRIPARRNVQVAHHANRAGLVIQHDHGAGAQTAAGLLHRIEIHRHVEMLVDEKFGRRAARKHAAKLYAVAHAAGVLFQDLANGRAHAAAPTALDSSLFRSRRTAWCRPRRCGSGS